MMLNTTSCTSSTFHHPNYCVSLKSITLGANALLLKLYGRLGSRYLCAVVFPMVRRVVFIAIRELQVFPEDVKLQLRYVNNVSKRDLVLLGLTVKCRGCKGWSGLISAPLMQVSGPGILLYVSVECS